MGAVKDEEVVAALRASRRRSAVELAELLDSLTHGGLSAATLITYFKRAFPGIPLRTLLDAGAWKRVCRGDDVLSDEEFNELLRKWLEEAEAPSGVPQVESELAIREPGLHLVGEFTCTACPVQAEGSIASHPFYFRARWDRWSFAVSLSPSVDPVDVSSASQGFFRESKYGSGDSDAGYMPLEEARAVVLRCAREYLIEHSA